LLARACVMTSTSSGGVASAYCGGIWSVSVVRVYHASACVCFFFVNAEDGIRDLIVTGVQTCALPIFGELLSSVCVALGLLALARLVGIVGHRHGLTRVAIHLLELFDRAVEPQLSLLTNAQ